MNIFLDHVNNNNTNGLSGILDAVGYGCLKPLHWTIAPFAAERIRCHQVGRRVDEEIKRYKVMNTTNPICPQSGGYLTTAWRVASLVLGLLLVTFTTPLALLLKGMARFSQETRLKYQAEFPVKKDVNDIPENAEKVELNFLDARSICHVLHPIFGIHAFVNDRVQLINNFRIAYGKELDSSLPIQKTTNHVVLGDACVDYLVLKGDIAGYKKEKDWEYWLIFNPDDLKKVEEGKLAFAPGKDDIITKASLLARYRQEVKKDQPDEVVPSLFEKVRAYFKPVKIEE